MHSEVSVVQATLRAVGNIVTGDDVQTQVYVTHFLMIDPRIMIYMGLWDLSYFNRTECTILSLQVILNCSVMPCLLSLLSGNSIKESVRKEACWTISNITAGNRQQIQAVIDANVFPVLIRILGIAAFRYTDREKYLYLRFFCFHKEVLKYVNALSFDSTRKEAAWAITNASSGGSADQIRYLVDQGCIPPLCDLLTVMDAKIVQVKYTSISNVGIEGKVKHQKQTS